MTRPPVKQQKHKDANNTLDARSITDSAGTPDIQSSIKEVSSAIVHFVNDKNNRIPSADTRSRSTSPSSR